MPGDHLDRLLALGIIKPGPEWQIRLMGGGDADKLGNALTGQEMGIDGSGELPYAPILDRTGAGLTPIQDVDSLPATTDPVARKRARVTLAK